MKAKYILFYLLILFIIIVTILGMVLLKNGINFDDKKIKVINEIKINEAIKINQNFEWVYDNSISHDNIIIPYINIKDKNIKKINNKFKINKNVLSSNYLYTFNGDLLSIVYVKNYESKKVYETYNINMGNTKILNSLETLEYIGVSATNVKNICLSTIQMELSLNYDENLYDEYYSKTEEMFLEDFYKGNLTIYIGSQKEVTVFVNMYTDKEYIKIINIIDKK